MSDGPIERIDHIIRAVFIIIVAATIGFLGGYFMQSGRLAETEEYLHAARTESERLRDRIAESQRTIDELERITEERITTVRELEKQIYDLITGARRRDEIIAGLESEIARAGGYTRSIAELAHEGRGIVERLLQEKTGGSN
jgi:predicted  nucleic acid-binding Zn-ribbon protein